MRRGCLLKEPREERGKHAPSGGRRRPVARQFVRKCKGNEDCQEQHACEDETLDEPAAVLYVHEKQNYQKHLYDCNGQSRDGVKRAEVNIGHARSERGEAEKRDENSKVKLYRD